MNSPDDKLPDGGLPDDGLIAQLGRLGAAAEASVEPTHADDVHVTAPTALPVTANGSFKRPRRAGFALAVAAALVLIAGAGAALFVRDTEPEAALTTQPGVQQLTGQEAVVPDNGWDELRECESSGQYDIDTGNGFYGAYQFTSSTWETVGGVGNPASASPLEQDLRAAALYTERGSEPWPICKRVISGPMPNPLLAEWEEAWHQPHRLTVAVNADATDAQRATLESRMAAIAQGPVEFVSPEVLAAELTELLPAGPAVESDGLTSLLIAPLAWRSTNEAEIQGLIELPGSESVFVQPVRPSTRIEIPALGLDQLSPAAWRLDDLRSQVVALAPTGWQSVPDPVTFAEWSSRERERALASFSPLLPDDGPLVLASAAWDLSRLSPGDEIRVTADVDPNRGVQSALQVVVAGSAQDRDVDQLTGPGLRTLGSVVLVAPHPTEPDRRIVVRTESETMSEVRVAD
jgi:hypothetical protein